MKSLLLLCSLCLVISVHQAEGQANWQNCQNIKCKYGGKCVMVKAKPKCVCLLRCLRVFRPVCGTNGVVYASKCVLDYNTCKSKGKIKLKYNGMCVRHKLVCPPASRRPCLLNPPPPNQCSNHYHCRHRHGNLVLCCQDVCNQKCYDIRTKKFLKPTGSKFTCKNVRCSAGHLCRMNHGYPKCVCNRACPKILKPVCGSDGRTYSNACLLKVQACVTGRRITIAKQGPCRGNTCANVKCGWGARCVMRIGKPICDCTRPCVLILKPVCGTDGKTYSNKCVLDVATCKSKGKIRLAHNGACFSACPRLFSLPPCRFPMVKDDCKTNKDCRHGNHVNCCRDTCRRRCFNTKTRKWVAPGQDKRCPKIKPALCIVFEPSQCTADHHCHRHGKTLLCCHALCSKKCYNPKTNKFLSVCPQICPLYYGPVCGTDGKTYSNRCFLDIATCTSNRRIRLKHSGPCRKTCANVKCGWGARCVMRIGKPICDCTRPCVLILKPVCGTDGKTYSNKCVLDVATCKSKGKIRLAHNGACSSVCPRFLSLRPCRFPMVKDDCRTNKDCRHGNHVICCRDTCRRRCFNTKTRKWVAPGLDKRCPRITPGYCFVFEPSQCTADHHCHRHGKTLLCCQDICSKKCYNLKTKKFLSVCPQFCLLNYAPVCGTDGKTYSNKCSLDIATCTSNGRILLEYNGPCRKNCANVKCGLGARCVMRNGKPRCDCTRPCPLILKPVCGTDGKTYSNKCFLDAATCKSKGKIRLAHNGACFSACPRLLSLPPCRFPMVKDDCKTKQDCRHGNHVNCCRDTCHRRCFNTKTRKWVAPGHDKRCPRITPGACLIFVPSQCTADHHCHRHGKTLLCCQSICSKKCYNPTTKKFLSVCPQICPLNYAPVCGTDGKTYGNKCSLIIATCTSNGRIRLKHSGPCKRPPITCANISCRPGTVCKIVGIIGTPVCVCNEVCTREYRPVCGSNGKTYSNLCMLLVDSCKNNWKIHLVRNGSCAITCANIRCRPGMVCKMIVGTPVCVCNEVCTREYRPVCGSNGKTYSNLCMLMVASCKNNWKIHLVRNGSCAITCANIRCRPGMVCKMIVGTPVCVCNEVCTREYRPVCGSNGKTYSNLCMLMVASCKDNWKIHLVHIGSCVPRPCITICTREYAPVCGTDGKTYSNLCLLAVASCKSNWKIRFKHNGPCLPKKCPDACIAIADPVCGSDGKVYGNSCLLSIAACNSKGRIKFVHKGFCVRKPCKKACPKILSPVCGTDGKTYNNLCMLAVASCKSNWKIRFKRKGKCVCFKLVCPPLSRRACLISYPPPNQCSRHDDCSRHGKYVLCCQGVCNKGCYNARTKKFMPPDICDKPCPAIFKPVCGTDWKTYSNECVLSIATCKSKSKIMLAHPGACGVCPKFCPLNYAPVCGTDGKTYSNRCFLNITTCNSNGRIRLKHSGPCKRPPITCANIRCRPGMVCKMIVGTPVCVCNEVCTREFRPVCGSNGKTYSNLCMLMVASCKNNWKIHLVHNGPCVPRPCITMCTREYAPVCGTDGKTYSNLCLLAVASCKSSWKIKFKHNGPCLPKKCPDACIAIADPVCGSDGKDYGNPCLLGIASCKSKGRIKFAHKGFCVRKPCKKACPKILSPVCGTDGKTYNNLCLLAVASCKSNWKIHFKHKGKCVCFKLACPPLSRRACLISYPPPNQCSRHGDCSRHGKYVLCCQGVCNTGCYNARTKKFMPPDICDKPCPAIFKPVCGTDWKTYSNECVLSIATCKSKSKIMLAHSGACALTKCQREYLERKKNPLPGALVPRCDKNGLYTRVQCNLSLPPSVACYCVNIFTGKEIPVTRRPSPGNTPPCPRSCDNVFCSHRARCVMKNGKPVCVCDKPCTKILNPVCGTDGKTYSNKCLLEIATCKSKGKIRLKHYGKCGCDRPCLKILKPICGSNGKTYNNLCLLDIAICKGSGRIKFVHEGKCVSRPCALACGRSLAPVCGTDGKTYNNLCLLTVASCVSQWTIRFKHHGKCACKRACRKILKPVCGLDGRTYNNECVLKEHACNVGRNITVFRNAPCSSLTKCQHRRLAESWRQRFIPDLPVAQCDANGLFKSLQCGGFTLPGQHCWCVNIHTGIEIPGTRRPLGNQTPCPACSTAPCTFGAPCVMRNGKPVCVCERACSKLLRPVCGTDGKTYPNYCVLDIATCKSKGKIRSKHKGKCGVTKCQREYLERINNPLPGALIPRCDKNGLYTRVQCKLSLQPPMACYCVNIFTGKEIPGTQRPFPGNTPPCPRTCETVSCKHGAKCVIKSGMPVCDCNRGCIEIFQPVCGTDGKTYSNTCFLSIATCKSKGKIRLKHKGTCRISQCSVVKCGWGAHCVVRNDKPVCECNKLCPLFAMPVCGSNGKTYANKCVLSIAYCNSKGKILLAHDGKCVPKPCRMACPRHYAPVCGTDGRTYGNLCVLTVVSCKSNWMIRFKHKGKCGAPTTVCARTTCPRFQVCRVKNGKASCGPVTNCPQVYQPVCGSDGRTHSNVCLLKAQAALDKIKIHVVHVGTCSVSICKKRCSLRFVPVCGSNGVTYYNECNLVRNARCQWPGLYKKYNGLCRCKGRW